MGFFRCVFHADVSSVTTFPPGRPRSCGGAKAVAALLTGRVTVVVVVVAAAAVVADDDDDDDDA